MMPSRVLLAHNFYRQAGGEDTAYRNERELLQSHGIEVYAYERHNQEVNDQSKLVLLTHAASLAWNRASYNEIARIIRQFRPHIAHFHNTFQLISPSVYKACQDNGVPVVQTVHNYRLVCPGGLLQRDGVPCEDCVGHTLLPALRHRCYRQSFAGTAAVVWMLQRNRIMGTYKKYVDRYIALTSFAASRLLAGGLPSGKTTVKPNFLPSPPPAGPGGGRYVVYVGRLNEEKGIYTLLHAWNQLGNIPLRIIGDGPLGSDVRAAAENSRGAITWLGQLDRAEIMKNLLQAELLIIPSEWYEGFPMVVLEAYACATPVLASRIGSLDEVVIDGVTGYKFQPRNADELARQMRVLWQDLERLHEMRPLVRRHFEERYTADRNYAVLTGIYRDVIDAHVHGDVSQA